MGRLARQSPGWAITRHPVPGERRIYAEIRSDKNVETGPPTRHWHGTPGTEPDDLFADVGTQSLRRGTRAYVMHCKRVNKYNEENGIDAPDHFTVEEVHEHIDDAKYVFPPSGKKRKVWSHDHNAPRTKAYYERNPKESYKHCYWWHHRMQPDDVEAAVSGEHDHRRDVKDYSNSLAKRLDIHPRALKRLAKAEVVYFVIEGCLKADAVLSAIERDDRSESVFSVPSVTL